MPNLLICPDLFVIGYSHQYNLFPGIRGYHLQINVISTWCHLQCHLCTAGTLRGLKLFLRVHPVLHGPFLMFHLLQPHTVDAVWARPLSTQVFYLLFHNAPIFVEVACVVLHQKLYGGKMLLDFNLSQIPGEIILLHILRIYPILYRILVCVLFQVRGTPVIVCFVDTGDIVDHYN